MWSNWNNPLTLGQASDSPAAADTLWLGPYLRVLGFWIGIQEFAFLTDSWGTVMMLRKPHSRNHWHGQEMSSEALLSGKGSSPLEVRWARSSGEQHPRQSPPAHSATLGAEHKRGSQNQCCPSVTLPSVIQREESYSPATDQQLYCKQGQVPGRTRMLWFLPSPVMGQDSIGVSRGCQEHRPCFVLT